ncbi:MAG: MFS transporter [Bacteroidetes bacterium]|nr:MFS transporter [Fibrella sp.]
MLVNLYRNAYGGIPRPVWLLALVMLVNRSGTMVIPFMTVYLTRQLQFTLGEAGLVMSLFGVGSIAGAYIGGRLTDRFGHYFVQIGALFAGGLGFIGLGQLHTLPQLSIGIFLLSLTAETFRPANGASIAQYSTTENRTRAYSLNRLAVNLGWSVGPVLGGFLATLGWNYLFWVDGLTCITAGVVLWAFLPRPATVVKAIDQPSNNGRIASTQSAYRDKNYLWFILFTSFNAIAFFQFFFVVPVYFRQSLGLTEFEIGLAMSLNGVLIVAVEMLLVYRLDGRRNPLRYIIYGVLLNGLAFLLMNIFGGFAVAAVLTCVLAITFGEMLSMPFLNAFWAGRANDRNRGQYAGLYSMSYSVAHILAPSIGTQVAQRAGFPMLWFLIAGCCGISALGFWWLSKQTKATNQPPSDPTVQLAPNTALTSN